MENPILLFDGVCNFCNSAVQFIIKRDPKGVFRFSALQSETGQQCLSRHEMPVDQLSTLVLVEGERVYLRSTAALRIARRLRFPWPALYLFIVVPRPLRDPVYNWIARHRYQWFGKRDACMIPSPEVRSRFL